jgi:hypothetical protein
MGSGSFDRHEFASYTRSTKNVSLHKDGTLDGDFSAQEMFTRRSIADKLNPSGVIRECCDSEEHPNTIPVILGIDVTGSMGKAAVEVAKKIGVIMTTLFDEVKDVEFMVMGIGDLDYDVAPLQVSQFESDVRIAVALDKIYFEGHGGGNSFESYTEAWYFGLTRCKLDCWKRGKKGIIITLGDEPLNPYLPDRLCRILDNQQYNQEVDESLLQTDKLYEMASEKYDIYHLAIDDNETSYFRYSSRILSSFGKYLAGDHLKVVTMDNLASTIINIVKNAATAAEKPEEVESFIQQSTTTQNTNSGGYNGISW